MNNAEHGFLKAVGDTLVPHGAVFESGARDTNFTDKIEELLAAGPKVVEWAVRGSFFLFNYLPAPGAGKFGAFASCSPEVRLKTVQAWGHSRLYMRRSVMKILRALVYMTVYNDAAVQRDIGYSVSLATSGSVKKTAAKNSGPRAKSGAARKTAPAKSGVVRNSGPRAKSAAAGKPGPRAKSGAAGKTAPAKSGAARKKAASKAGKRK